MLPEKINQMLKDYREYLGRCAHLRREIELLERKAASLRMTMVADAVSTSSKVSDMPHGTTVSSPTEKVATMFADGYVPTYIKEIESDIERYKEEVADKEIVVVFVEAWLKGLTDKERWLIERQVIDGAYWREIIIEYKEKYGDDYSREGLKRIKNAAMAKIYRIAS